MSGTHASPSWNGALPSWRHSSANCSPGSDRTPPTLRYPLRPTRRTLRLPSSRRKREKRTQLVVRSHGLKRAFGPEAFARLAAAFVDPFDTTDSEAAPYADLFFKYDAQHRVIEEQVLGLGCSVCSGGIGTYTFSYDSNDDFADSYSTWRYQTVETLPDGNQNIVYTNFAGEVLLQVYRDATTEQEWLDFYAYDAAGRLVLHAGPSAVTGYDEELPDLLGWEDGNYTYLADEVGRIERWQYYADTDVTSPGYFQMASLQQGELGTAVPQQSVTYVRQTAADGSVTVLPANVTVYRNDNGTGAQTTTYSYTWFSGTTRIASLTTTLPAVTVGQNGPGSADVTTTFHDSFGRPIWTRDAADFLHYTEYDEATGAVVKTITDVDTTRTGDFADLPSGWSTPTGGGLHLITTAEVDHLGRTIAFTDANGNATDTVYNDANYEVRIYPGWDTTAEAPTGPITVIREDRPHSYTEMLTMAAVPTVDGSGRPTGQEAIADVLTLSRSYTNAAGQVTHVDQYFDLSGLTYSTAVNLGTEGTHFYRTRYGYDHRGRLHRVESPTGTITRMIYDGLGRVVGEWVGTDDTPDEGFWSPENTTGTNLVKVTEYVYDGGGVGDSNLTQMTDFPGGGAEDRVTQYFHDWRNRLVASKGGVQGSEDDAQRPILYTEYDNLSQAIATEQYDGDGVTITIANGVPDKPDAGLLRARGTAAYDDQGRVFRTQTFSVDQSSGAVSATALTSDTWFDHRGNVIKTASPGGLVSKMQYDGAGRLTKSFASDGGGDTGWADAGNVTDDVVLTQTEMQYDANGNVILVLSKDRFHDATSTGELGDPATAPAARVTYVASYFDALDRMTATVDVGTNGGTAWTRPSSVPGRSDTELVSSYTYHAAGWVEDVTDPRGLVTRTSYDHLGRVTKVVEAFSQTLLGSAAINQQQAPDDFSDAGADWEDLGTFTLTGTQLVVELSDGVSGEVIADAIRVERVDTPPLSVQISDDSETGFSVSSGTWNPGYTESGHADYLGSVTWADPTPTPGTATATAEWTFAVAPGSYQVWVGYNGYSWAATDTPFTVSDGTTALSTVRLNQQQTPTDLVEGGIGWADLGAFSITGGALVVQLSNDANNYVFADAIRIARVDAPPPVQILDDGDAGFDAGGFTPVSGQGFGDDVHRSDTGTGANVARWVFTVTPGSYRVSATWTADGNRPTAAPYTIWEGGVPSGNANRTTTYTYDGSDHLLTLTAWEAGGATYQTTQWVYGVASSTISSNDLLAETRYPDPATGDPSTAAGDMESYSYNALGEMVTRTDRNGTVHAYSYDVLGRLTADAVTQFGAGVDQALQRIETAYDTAGRPFLFTSFDAPSGGNVVNQVERVYNGLGQLIIEYQEHGGEVDTQTTPSVAYAYTEMSGGANHSRLISMTYPDGRVLHFVYGSGLDDAISRLTQLADDASGAPGQVLEGYEYLGLGTVVRRYRPEPEVELTYVKQGMEDDGEAGDQYSGLDRFGRVIDQRWLRTSDDMETDRFGYGYDANSNRLYRENLIDAAFSELYHTNGESAGYDLFNQLTAFARGELSDSGSDDVPDTVTTATRSQDWELDALGNWSSVTTDSVEEERTHNLQNQITTIDSQTTLTYDGNGNLTTDQTGNTLVYDAWNRLVRVEDGSTPLAAYTHNALNRRVTEDHAGTLTDLYYSAAWQVLEEHVDGEVYAQHVWSQVYVDALVLRDRDANGQSGDGLEERLYVQQDANWNVTALVDAAGNVVERYIQDPYGTFVVLAPNWTTQGVSAYDWGYVHQGGRFDGVVGLYHFRNREYSPELGRFPQRDPIELAGGLNLYGYVGNNPTNYTDPPGLLRVGIKIHVPIASIISASVDVSIGTGGFGLAGGLGVGTPLPSAIIYAGPGSKPPVGSSGNVSFAASFIPVPIGAVPTPCGPVALAIPTGLGIWFSTNGNPITGPAPPAPPGTNWFGVGVAIGTGFYYDFLAWQFI